MAAPLESVTCPEMVALALICAKPGTRDANRKAGSNQSFLQADRPGSITGEWSYGKIVMAESPGENALLNASEVYP
jgi:hypothetical protein